jgi:hypothetical protein
MDFRPHGGEHWDLSTVLSGERKREARIPTSISLRAYLTLFHTCRIIFRTPTSPNALKRSQ